MKTILYTDDNAFDRTAFERLMKKFPEHSYELAGSVDEMHFKLSTSSYDICIRDFYIPGEQDVQTEPTKHEEMFFISGSQHALDKLSAIGIHESRLILKPFTQQKLDQILHDKALSVIPDISYVDELSDGDDEFKLSMIQIFVEEVPVQLQQASSLLSDEKYILLADTIHALQTKIRTFGLNQINDVADELEEEARNSTEPEKAHLRKQLEEINSALLKTVEHLKHEWML